MVRSIFYLVVFRFVSVYARSLDYVFILW